MTLKFKPLAPQTPAHKSQNALMERLASHRPRVPKAELPAFEHTLSRIVIIANTMNAAVDELMSHVAMRSNGKHVKGAPVGGRKCGHKKCWCAESDIASTIGGFAPPANERN